jgi:glucosamine 6-phosphate synthetase-like amidotransferase/phosphosugar isomerase protein
MPAIFVILDSSPEDKRIAISTMRKIIAMKIQMHAIIISDCQDSETRALFIEFCNSDDQRIHYVPKSGEALSGLLCVVPLQRLAFDTTIALGYNPDRPRNLAKELTTQ